LRALLERRFPQPDLSTVVAPSGGVQRTTLQRTRERPPHYNPPKNGLYLESFAKLAPGHLNLSADPVFSYSCLALPRLHFEGVQSLMGCKQYARMLGLSRGYPYILYLSLSKWDAGPSPKFFHRATLPLNIRWHVGAVPPRICHCSSFSVACQVAVQDFRAAHASISARAEVRRFRSEREKFRLSSRGHFSTAGPMAT
jgi:hypothetical protein